MPNIFAIIVTYNAMRHSWIDHCLKSLTESTVPVKVVIVDNGSTDGTRDHVPVAYPDAAWLPQECNLGFGQANNEGIRYALANDADYVLLLNQDATLAPDALEKMLKACQDDTLVSPLQLNGDGSKLDLIFKEKLLRTGLSVFDDIFTGHPLQDAYVGGDFSAACWLLPRHLLLEVGGFNPIFFHYGEDDNYLHRVAYHGFRVVLAAKARMYHDREIHGNQEAFNKNAYRREMLCEICDINLSMPIVMWKWALRLYHSYVYQLPNRKYRVGTFLKQLFWFVSHSLDVLESRKGDKRRGQNWL